jgi:hypothetical protein
MSQGENISRRAFLGGAGTVLGVPLFTSIVPRSWAANAPPASPGRLLFYFVPNGIVPASYNPQPYGENWIASGILKPLEAVRDDVVVVKNLMTSGFEGGSGPHTKATGAFLTCQPIEYVQGGGVAAGISVDQVAAQAIGGATRFRSLELGAGAINWMGFCEESYSCAYLQSIAWSGPKTPLGKMVHPKAVFDRLFAGYDPLKSAEEIALRTKERKSVLDYVLGETKSLRGVLGSADAYRLDEYLDGVRELERKVASFPPPCESISPGEVFADMPLRVELMTDLMVLAFQCDQTRVISFMLDDGFASTVYSWLGLSDGHHWYTHHSGNEDMIAATSLIATWGVAQFASLVEKMGKIPEGEGTLLDHSLLVYGNSCGECNYHSPYDVPTVLAGRGNGAVTPGRSIQVEDGTPRADLYTAMLHSVGVKVDSFGKYGTGPLQGLK